MKLAYNAAIACFFSAVPGCGLAVRAIYNKATEPEAFESEQCPKAGSFVPFAQLKAQAKRFSSCEVTTTVRFEGTGTGGLLMNVPEGLTVFRVLPPNTGSKGNALIPNLVLIPDPAASQLFSMAPGTLINLSGKMVVIVQMGSTIGQNFQATSLGVVPEVAPQ